MVFLDFYRPLVEAGMVVEGRFGEPGGAELDLWLHKAKVEVAAVTAEHADQARRAWRRYGKQLEPLRTQLAGI